MFLARWAKGLSLMLEKMLGCTFLTKLRAILLMEAEFNHSNKSPRSENVCRAKEGSVSSKMGKRAISDA